MGMVSAMPLYERPMGSAGPSPDVGGPKLGCIAIGHKEDCSWPDPGCGKRWGLWPRTKSVKLFLP